MLQISDATISLKSDDKKIIRGLSLDLLPTLVTLLTGRNGSGKSTLVNTIMGHPDFEITQGKIFLKDETYPAHILEMIQQEINDEEAEFEYELQAESVVIKKLDITNLSPTTKSLLGLFLANQYPTEIPGVGLSSFLRMIYNSHQPKERQMPVFKFKKFLEEQAELVKYPRELLKRNLNEGFSGGEKKKTEILQMLILKPRYVFLDEIDSGLDKQATKEVFECLKEFKVQNPTSSITVISHYEHLQSYLEIDNFIEIKNGEISQ